MSSESSLESEIERRRTFASFHPDAGKTTITEKLLLQRSDRYREREVAQVDRHATSVDADGAAARHFGDDSLCSFPTPAAR